MMSVDWSDAILLVIGFGIILYAYGVWEGGYFKRRGVKYVPFDYPIVGNFLKVLTRKEHLMDVVYRVYNAFPKEKYVGFMQVNRPFIMIRDLEIIKQTTIKDFDNFSSHNLNINEDFDPIIGRNLLFITGDHWKDMRATVSPTFTSSKLKNMISLVDDTANQIVEFYLKKMKDLIEVEMTDTLTRYTNDVIASTVFGLKVDSLDERDNEFYKIVLKSMDLTGIQLFKLIVHLSYPILLKMTGIKFLGQDLTDFFRNLVLGTMKNREKNGIVRHDMIQLLMEAWKGSLKYEPSQNDDNDAGFATAEESTIGRQTVKTKWSENDIVAQAVIFYIAGFETTTTLLSFAIHELTVNPDVQKKLQNEIDELIAEKGDMLNYMDLMKMKYLDMVVCEALRMWPPIPGTDRKCIRPYTFPPSNDSADKGYTMQAGEGILIPIYAIHRDARYFPEPHQFKPERFSNENKRNINPLSFIPFGVGPRNCIGSRYVLTVTKTVIFRLLSKFDLTMTEKTQNPIMISFKTIAVQPRDGVWVGLKPRNN
ncbi:cytochrome P450 9e2-like [Arctopsyche grandis]|uniref:cytochrome P450 9e2-like n=1 Tax=Arctopsyche grandis TaxID=121162 RepID=UPI00406D97AC